MARLDTATINGYESMSAEEKVAALESFEFDDHAEAATESQKYKEALDKATHDASEYKKQLKALQEQTKNGNAKADDTIAALQKQVEALTRQNTVASYTAQYTSMGYSPELAAETAEAQTDGDIAKVMENHRKFLEEHDKQIKADILKLSSIERLRFANEFPEEYAKLYNGG